MCRVCGCGDGATTAVNLQTGEPMAMSGEPDRAHTHGAHTHTHTHTHAHTHGDGAGHLHAHAPAGTVEIETRILARNDALAAGNRDWLARRGLLALNLMSAPGAGKTTLLERTIHDISGQIPVFVLEGDQATTNDGDRIRAAGAAAVQVNTGTGCHLDADMVARGLSALDPSPGSLVFIENVGNLVCPALFDLGEHAKVVILSVTEGEDKPLKYPHMFRAADLLLVNKIDLLPYTDFDVARAVANARAVNPDISVLRVSARTGENLAAWYGWVRGRLSAAAEAVAT